MFRQTLQINEIDLIREKNILLSLYLLSLYITYSFDICLYLISKVLIAFTGNC